MSSHIDGMDVIQSVIDTHTGGVGSLMEHTDMWNMWIIMMNNITIMEHWDMQSRVCRCPRRFHEWGEVVDDTTTTGTSVCGSVSPKIC